MHKLTLIPLLGVLFTMAPLAAFADTPSVTITPSDIYVDDSIHNFDDENGNGLGLLDWSCSGLGVNPVTHHTIQAEIFALGNDAPVWDGIVSCSEFNRDDFIGSIEGRAWDGDAQIVVWDDNILGDDPNFASQSSYSELIENTGGWIVATSTVHMHSGNRPI